MKNNKFRLRLFFFFQLLSMGLGLQVAAQDLKKLDQKVKDGTVLMYKNPEEAIKVGNQIIEEAKDNVDYKIKAFKLISDAYSSKRDYQKSLEYVLKASQLLHLSKNKILKIVVINKLGIQYHQLKIYDKSMQYLDQAEQLMLDHPQKDSVLHYLGTNYIVRGFIYKEKLNCDIALEYFDKGIDALVSSKSIMANSGISIAKYNKGNCYILSSEYDKAIANFQMSFQHAKIVNASSLKAFALKGLAQVYTLQGQYNQALATLNQAHLISTKVDDLVLNQEIFKGLSENYLALNQWELYKEYHLRYLNNQTQVKIRERKGISDSLAEKKMELASKLESHLGLFYFAFGLIIIVIAGFFVFFARRINTTKSAIVAVQNRIATLEKPRT